MPPVTCSRCARVTTRARAESVLHRICGVAQTTWICDPCAEELERDIARFLGYPSADRITRGPRP